jgi:hypothetical protein
MAIALCYLASREAEFSSQIELLPATATPASVGERGNHCLYMVIEKGNRESACTVLVRYSVSWGTHNCVMSPLYTLKKVNDFPVPSQDVTYQTLPGQE